MSTLVFLQLVSESSMNYTLLLGKFEAYSVLHTMYLWMRVG